MPIFVNKKEITDDDVFTEMQYHPAEDLEAARNAAAQALVVQELLVQQAMNEGRLQPADSKETREEATFQLMQDNVSAPEATTENCQIYYQNNLSRFKDAHHAERTVPFEAVQDKIKDYLHTQSMRSGIRSYLMTLAADAKIAGFDLEASL